jgi:hypothetical protein
LNRLSRCGSILRGIDEGEKMGPSGAIIMGFFGTFFAVMGLVPLVGAHSPLLILPLLVGGGLIVMAAAGMRRGLYRNERPPRAGKVIMWSSIAEGVGIFLAANLLQNLGRPDLLLPAIAAIVGLHFLPMAYAIPFRPFYGEGIALLVVAAVGFVLPAPAGAVFAGETAAIALWIASFAALRRSGSRRSPA